MYGRLSINVIRDKQTRWESTQDDGCFHVLAARLDHMTSDSSEYEEHGCPKASYRFHR